MRLTNALVAAAGIAAGWTFSAACFPSDEVQAVTLTLEFLGGASREFMVVGDRDTVRAAAYTKGYPSRMKYDSKGDSRRFAYHSSDTSVASVDLDGVVIAHKIGVTELTASVEGVTSHRMEVYTSAAAHAFKLTPATVDANPGDTISLTVTAVDSNDVAVPGVIFFVSTDTTWWNAIGPPIETGVLRTPSVVHFRAKVVGEQRVFARVMYRFGRPAATLDSPPTRVRVLP